MPSEDLQAKQIEQYTWRADDLPTVPFGCMWNNCLTERGGIPVSTCMMHQWVKPPAFVHHFGMGFLMVERGLKYPTRRSGPCIAQEGQLHGFCSKSLNEIAVSAINIVRRIHLSRSTSQSKVANSLSQTKIALFSIQIRQKALAIWWDLEGCYWVRMVKAKGKFQALMPYCVQVLQIQKPRVFLFARKSKRIGFL